MKFSDETKEVTEFNNNYFDFGVHKVKIAEVRLDTTENGKEFVEVGVIDPENAEITDSARVWFTTDKAANYSFNVLRAIFVHNSPEAKKDAARDLFAKLKSTEELVQVCQTLIGKECWFTKYYDPERTYTAQDGSQKRSINKNVMGYEPKVQHELMPAKNTGPMDLDALGVGKSAVDKVNDVMPGAEEVPFESEGDAPSANIPKKDDWTK